MATESCEVCGFTWDAVDPTALAPRVREAVGAFAAVLRAHPDEALVRPTPERWSAAEYAGHVRDVLVNLRDRIVLGAVEDDPRPHPMYGTPRVELGLYAGDTAGVLAGELEVVGDLFARTWERLPAHLRERPIFYPWPRPASRTLRWVAAQALHEAEHHLTDARAGLGGTGG